MHHNDIHSRAGSVLPRLLGGIIALTLTLPLPAMADCLTAADLERGVIFTFDNDDTTTVRALGEGMVEVVENYADGDLSRRFQSYIGPYIFRDQAISAAGSDVPDDWVILRFDRDITELPVPAPDLPPLTGTILWQEFGSSVIPETYVYEYRAGDPVALSGCTYDVVLVAGSFDRAAPDDFEYQQFSYYFPALGASVIVAWTNPEDGFLQALPTAVERMP